VFSAIACILVGLAGLVSPAFRGLSMLPAVSKDVKMQNNI